jgi:hypothetical protein
MQRSSKIGEVNHVNLVKTNIITDGHHQGSYNFAETAVHGLSTHETYDVEYHHKDPVYVDPPDRFAPLSQRVFQEWILAKAGAKTKMASDFDEPPMRRKPHAVSN